MLSGKIILFLRFLRRMQYYLREHLGSDFLFILLEMDEEDCLERIKKRHQGEGTEQIIELLKVSVLFILISY